jgi:hypothetical protein
MRVTLVILVILLLAAAAQAQKLEEDCCDDPAQNCCTPPPPPSVLPPLPVPPPTPPPPPVVLVPGVIVGPPPLALSVPKKKDDSRVMGKLSVGGAYQYMLDESAGGSDLNLMIGAEDSHWGGGAELGVVVGRVSGLTFTWLRIGAAFDWRITHRVHFNLGTALGMLSIERATSGSAMRSPTVGSYLGVTVDFKRDEPKGWFVFAKAGGDFVMAVTHLSAGALLLTSGLGYRL